MSSPSLRRSLRPAACAAAALLSLSCAAPRAAPPRDLNTALRSLGIETMGSTTLTVIKESRRRGQDKTFHTIVAHGPGLHLLIEAVSPMRAELAGPYANWRKKAIQALYEDPQSLYPGERALLTKCPAGSKPQELSLPVLGGYPSGLLANATADFAFGACAEGEVKQAGVYMPYYDPESMTLFQFNVFAPRESQRQDPPAPVKEFLRGLQRRPPER